jgi:hypothetical protein
VTILLRLRAHGPRVDRPITSLFLLPAGNKKQLTYNTLWYYKGGYRAQRRIHHAMFSQAKMVDTSLRSLIHPTGFMPYKPSPL